MGRDRKLSSPSRSPSSARSASRSPSRSPAPLPPPLPAAYSKRRSFSRSRSRSRSPSYRNGDSSATYRLHIGELGPDPNKAEVERAFSRFGQPIDVWVARAPPCFAFVVYPERRQAEKALEAMDGRALCRSDRIRVSWAKPRSGASGGGGSSHGYNPNLRCYECGELGHFSRECTSSRRGGGQGRQQQQRGRERDRPSSDWNRGGDRDRRFARDEPRDRFRPAPPSPPPQTAQSSSGYRNSNRRDNYRHYDNTVPQASSNYRGHGGGGGGGDYRGRRGNYGDRRAVSPIIDLSPRSDRS